MLPQKGGQGQLCRFGSTSALFYIRRNSCRLPTNLPRWSCLPMSHPLDRRQFLEFGTAAGVALGAASALAEEKKEAKSAADKIVVGVMGVNGRGSSLAKGFAGKTGSEVAY